MVNHRCPSGKESACNAGNPRSIPGLGRSAGEEIGYPLWYSWASLVVQLVKNLPATQKCPDTPVSLECNTEGPGTASSEPLLPS